MNINKVLDLVHSFCEHNVYTDGAQVSIEYDKRWDLYFFSFGMCPKRFPLFNLDEEMSAQYIYGFLHGYYFRLFTFELKENY